MDFPIPDGVSLLASGTPAIEWHTLVRSMGLLLLAAVLAGLVAQRLHVPKVTAYLLVGVLLGPQVLKAIPHGNFEYYLPLERLAMSLVLFGMGCHFTLSHVRRIIRPVLRLLAGEASFTFVLVSGGLFIAYGFWSGLGMNAWQPAVLFGALAVATAPATTVLVLKESQAEGPMTEYVTALVALNNLTAVVLFEVLFLAVFLTNGTAQIPVHRELAIFAGVLAGSILLGGAAGLVMSYGCGLLAQRSWLVMLVGITTLTLGVCETLDIPYLLTFLAMGVTVANTSDRPQDLSDELDRWTGLLCVVFFVVHGAELDLRALLAAGAIGAAYIGLRSAGKYLGIYFAAGSRHEDAYIRPWLGLTMLSQAGAAIALASLAAESGIKIGDFNLGEQLLSIILGTVVIFELTGPILLRMSLIRAGEVPVSQAIYHSTTNPLEELRLIGNRVMVALGFTPWGGRAPEDITVGQMMRRFPKAIPATANFEEVVDFIEHSQDNTYPVVGPDGELIGIIRYSHLRNALFDADLGSLVRAADLAIPCPRLLHPDDPLTQTWVHFRHGLDDGIPVVTREEPQQLVGLLKRRDLYRMFSRRGMGQNKNDRK
jgi:Kef-type K+ transport system membrane component KefB